VQYRRTREAADTFFFTVNLRDRRSVLLLDYINILKNIVRDVTAIHQFARDAMVVLTQDWRAVCTLPPDDFAYSQRARLIKAGFAKHLLREGVPIEKGENGECKL